MPTETVENYIKAIYHLSGKGDGKVNTNAISDHLGTKAATVSDMLKKLAGYGLIKYKPYQPVQLTDKGKKMAVGIIRKHRLWEVFLVEKLGFGWDEVHEIAEDLEHIKSEKLINQLDEFLGKPRFDPHGDPIPDKDGNIQGKAQQPLSELVEGQKGQVTGVRDSSQVFLQFLDAQGIGLGTVILVKSIYEYDQSRKVEYRGNAISLSNQVCKNIYVQTIES
ncbi:MAG: metal-dependent transcriptional regulator [Salibacteraceae bacterium]